MITIICGNVGTGKTALMTKFALDHMVGAERQKDVANCRATIKKLNASGYELSLASKHVVYSDYTIRVSRKVVSHNVDGWYLGLPNDRIDTIFLPPNAVVCLDEAQRYYNSRVRSGIPNHVSRYYETHRHYGLSFYMVAQRPVLIDKNIRGIAERFIFVDKLSVKKHSDGYVSIIVWQCREFNNSDSAERYSDGGAVNGVATQYKYVGNIFNFYNSLEFLPFHLRNRQGSCIDCNPSMGGGYSPEYVAEFNASHGYDAPVGFYDKVTTRVESKTSYAVNGGVL